MVKPAIQGIFILRGAAGGVSHLLILTPGSWLLDSAVCKTAPPTRRFFIV